MVIDADLELKLRISVGGPSNAREALLRLRAADVDIADQVIQVRAWRGPRIPLWITHTCMTCVTSSGLCGARGTLDVVCAILACGESRAIVPPFADSIIAPGKVVTHSMSCCSGSQLASPCMWGSDNSAMFEIVSHNTSAIMSACDTG